MQKLAEISIKRPVFAAMIILALVVVGAAAYFRLGTYLQQHGRSDAAQAAFAQAKALRPESWNYKRQAWHLEEVGKSGGPEFWAEVKALGDRPYYPRSEL